MSQTLLSICIPTWNRKERLKRLLERIASEAKGLEHEVEVCVSDNGSTDGTREYLETVVAKGPLSARFHFNKANEGFDWNCFRAAYLATGKYLWFFGDDDLIVEGKLTGLVSFLKQITDESTQIIYMLDANALKVHPRSSSHDVVVHPFGFLSSVIIRREPFAGLDRKILAKGIGTRYVHAWVLICMALANPQVKIALYDFIIKVEKFSDGPRQRLSSNLATLRGSYLINLLTMYSVLMRPFFWSDLPRLIGNFARFTFLLLFLPICERKFRSNEQEQIELSFFIEKYSLFGLPIHIYRSILWLAPNFIADSLFSVAIFFLQKTKLTGHGYGHWAETWK